MNGLRVASLFASLFLNGVGWAQEADSPASVSSAQKTDTPKDPAQNRGRLPFDVAGYLSFRRLNDDALRGHHFYEEYSGSLFLGKSFGRWRFHSEFNVSNAPEFDSEGLHLFPARPSLSVKLDNGSLNYNARDWLQVTTGFLFVPTYWREHRYQSTVLTVDDPLIDQTIFATAFAGVMAHGNWYFRDGGFGYQIYGGIAQQTELDQGVNFRSNERFRAVGGKLVIHVPTRGFFDTFDAAFHRLHEQTDVDRDELYGGELHLEKNRLGLLSEFAHASMDIVRGSRSHIRQGYYVQPSYQITRKLFAVARYDRLTLDSRAASESGMARQLVGLTYRPVPELSLKLDADRYQPGGGEPAYYGGSVGVVYFFRLK